MATPMFAPDGSTHLIPNDQVTAAQQAGGRPVAPVPNVQMETSKAPQAIRALTGSLPAVGGGVGGTLAAPGVVTSALGGALGVGAGVEAKQLLDREIFGTPGHPKTDEPTTTSKTGLKELGTQMAVAGGTGLLMGSVAQLPTWLQEWRDSRAAGVIDNSAADFIRAIPPTKTTPYGPDDYQAARQYLEQEHPVGPQNGASVESVRDAADSGIKNIENRVHDLVQIVPNDPIKSNPLEDVEAELSANPRGQQFVKAGLKELEGLNLDNPTMAEADDIRGQLNAENRAVLKKNSYDLETARKADPGFAAREVAAESLRTGIYGQLADRGIGTPDSMNGIGVDELRQQEGSLIKIRNAAQNQIFNGSKTVSGSAEAGPVRQLASNALNKYLPPIVKELVPGANMIEPKDLTRDALLERSFGAKAANSPQSVPVNLRAIAETPSSGQLPLNPQVPTGQPGQGSLFGVTGTEPLPLEWSQEKLASTNVPAQYFQQILDNPLATASEKDFARQQLKIGSPKGTISKPEMSKGASILEILQSKAARK